MRYIEYAIALSTMTQELTESNKHRHELTVRRFLKEVER